MQFTQTRRLASARAVAAAGVVVLVGTAWLGAQQGRTSIPQHPDASAITHVLNRITFGARPGDVERVRSMGLSAYINEQLHPDQIDNHTLEARLASFQTLTMSTTELAEAYFIPALEMRRALAAAGRTGDAAVPPPEDGRMTPEATAEAGRNVMPPDARMVQARQQTVLNELMQAKMLRAAVSDRQLEEVLTDFWFNHFNVFIGKGQVRQYLTAYERDAIRPHVLGRFRDLLGAVAHSPAMLFYLDNFQSATPNAPQLRRPALPGRLGPRVGQNAPRPGDDLPPRARPARGLNENYAREIMELHTLGVDGGYTQEDVVALARILTGWTIDRPQLGGEFMFRPAMHDTGRKTFLGVSFPTDGEREGERALDLLAAHPATAKHISYQLAQRFVSDEPPAALVDRAAQVFLRTHGDLREVVRTIITSPEFFSPAAVRSKVKTPLEFVVSALRATGATITTAQPLVAAMRNLGMPLYGCQPPTGYSMTADAWVNTGALLNRMNFAVQLTSGVRIVPTDAPGRQAGPGPGGDGPAGRGRGLDGGRRPGPSPLRIDIAAIAPDTTGRSVGRVIDILLGGQAAATTRQTLARAETPQQLVALALGAPEFQRR